MKIVAITALGLLIILWLRFTRRHIDTPPWKPIDHSITNNRGDRR